MRLLFISDLHLDPERAEGIELFRHFLANQARDCDGLYILGDFLEYWLGDDDDAIGLAPALLDLSQLARGGCPVHLMRGNRDFLIGKEFADRYSVSLLPDPSPIDVLGHRLLLMHGDTLCTDDTAYQAFRARVRTLQWQQEFLAQPLPTRRALVRQLRADSRAATRDKTAEIMDVNHSAVAESMRRHNVRYLIHGHTHRPAIHRLDGEHGIAHRVVLGDWYQGGSFVSIDDYRLTLNHLAGDGQADQLAQCQLVH